ncbi:uncharacterized protein [Dermacentor albipictus]|uniref:uncharacterized protein isoform X3 n=1 Tax=Dermacentor albipictus TaxID=60249 RepID=UPI0038FCFF79
MAEESSNECMPLDLSMKAEATLAVLAACAVIQQRAVDNTRQLQDIETSAMAEESSNECMPLDLSMKAEATLAVLAACAVIQQRAVDNTRQLQDIETSAMAEESSNECMPLDLSQKAEATQRTSRDGTQGASSTLGAYRTISDDALRYPGNTQHTPTTNEICNVDGVPENGSTSHQRLGFIGNIDHARPSTSRAGMEEASASFEDGAMAARQLKKWPSPWPR